MRLELSPDSRVLVDLRATGLLRAVGHDPTLLAHPEPFALEVGDGPVDAAVVVHVRALAMHPPEHLGAGDRQKMHENMLGADVLDAARFPVVEWRGRFTGDTRRGKLSGELVIRGRAYRVDMDVEVVREDAGLRARCAWEGRLTDLGIKPFKALLGALRLEDWIRLRVDALFLTAPGQGPQVEQ